MATISNTPRPGYVYDSADAVWYPIGTGTHSHNEIATTIVDAKGDLIAATAADTVARLAVGANDTVLTADSSTATGLKWGTVSAGSNWSLLNTGGTALTGATTVTVSGISGKDKIFVIVQGASASASSKIGVRFNGDGDYNYYMAGIANAMTDSTTAYLDRESGDRQAALLGQQSTNASGVVTGYFTATGCNSSGVKMWTVAGGGNPNGGSYMYQYVWGGYWNSSAVVTSVSVSSSIGNLDAGTMYVYTSA
jgi:hypothetical protein